MRPALINSIFAGKAAEAFCWMLIHSLWQGLLFTIITGLVMILTKKSSSLLRYNIMSVLFFLFIAICAGTFIWQLNSGTSQPGEVQGAMGIISQSGLQLFLKKFTAWFTANASLILMGWLLVFLAKCVKMMASLVYSHRIKHYKVQQPPPYWINKMVALCTQLQLKKTVLLLESEIVKIPVVIGHLKPIVFMPVGLLTGLPAGEVEAVLLHELAHIRRNDYFVNIIQVIAENIFFFNPALLWMSSLLREERENCCDDVAVEQTKSKKQFIQALISFKEHALHTNKYATAFPAKKNQLLHRVSRIINNRNKTLNPVEKIFFLASFFLLAVLSLAVTNSNVMPAPKKPAQDKTSATGKSSVIMPPVQAIAGVDDVKRYVINNNDEPAPPADEKELFNLDAKTTGKQKPQVIEYYSKTIKIDNKAASAEDAKQEKIVEPQEMTDVQQAEEDRKQAIRDRQQAEEDRKQAIRDQQQAVLDQQQAVRDQQQAEKDQKQAELDRKQAEKDKENNDKQKPAAD